MATREAPTMPNRRSGLRGAPLPEAFCDLARLREIHVHRAGFTRLPARFGDLARLGVSRRLEELPASLGLIAKVDVEKKVEALFRDIRYRPDKFRLGVSRSCDGPARPLDGQSGSIGTWRITTVL